MAKIEQELLKYNLLYRAGTPEITDKEYDLMLDIYKLNVSDEQYNNFRVKLMEEPGKSKHPYIMGSLEKTKADEGDDSLVKWLTKNNIKELFVSAKIDGLSVRLSYVDGELVDAVTRGDGEYGESIYNKVIHFGKTTLGTNFTGHIRGEIVLTKENFIKLCELDNKEYKNPRTSAVGLINSKEFNVTAIKLLDIVTYEIIGENSTKSEQFSKLIDLGLKVAENNVIVKINNSNIKHVLLDMFKLFSNICKYEIDGVVLTSRYNTVFENKKIPDGTVAFKANLNSKETTIIDIEWTLSKSGWYKPVAIISPIELGGAMIARSSLYNYQQVKDKNIRYGATVTVLKSGEIIPVITSIDNSKVLNNNLISIPIVCEFCNTTLIIEGVEIKCPNKDCSEQNLLQLSQFIRRLEIADASTKTLRNLGITSFSEFITWRPLVGSKSQEKLYKEIIDKIFSIKREKIFAALDCDGMGEKTVNKLIEHFGFANILNKTANFTGILPTGIGQTTMETFLTTLDKNIELYNMFILDNRYNEPSTNVVTSSNSGHLTGKSYCFTGKLNTMTRSQAEYIATSAGGKIAGVSKTLTYLVTNDKDSGSSKNKKAQELGITLINENEFLEQINNQSIDSL